MFYLLQVSFADMTVCKKIASNTESENVSKDYYKSLIVIEKKDSVKGQKRENGTKGKKGNKEEKGNIVQINETEINQLKHKI